jgi:hypothetical protein
MKSAAVVLAITLAACGDDGYDPNACVPDGVADADGKVMNEALGPFVRAQLVATHEATGPSHALSLDEVAGACGEVAPTGKHLVFLFCEAPRALHYTIASEQTFHCPTNDVLALVEKDGGKDFATATSGTIDILHTGGCNDGVYAATFGIDEVTGTFDAVECP